MNVSELRREIRARGNEAIAEHSQRFFKTGKGEYGEGDKFLGIRVPVIRQLVRAHRSVPVGKIMSFVRSPYHEERLFGVLSLVDRHQRGDEHDKSEIYRTYYWRGENDKIGFGHETPLAQKTLAALQRARATHPAIGDSWILPAALWARQLR